MDFNFIVYDLEFNQDFSPKETKTKTTKSCGSAARPCFEIIQIGAVKLDQALNAITTLDRYVKPSIYPEVSPFITELTGITTERLSQEAFFPEVYQAFIDLTSENSVLCVWGMSDLKELYRNIAFHGLDRSVMPRNYINLQGYVSKHFGLMQGRSIKLKSAAELLEIPLIHPFHNACYDAYYTAEILKRIYNTSIQPTVYDPDFKPVRQRQARRTVNFNELIAQFEKMYQRNMTEEEQQMILLAYKMGKTRQFLK